MKLLAQIKWLYVLPFLLSGCDNIPIVDKVTAPDYKATGRSRPLEVPPDLTSATSNDTYAIPGSTSYSDFKNGQKQDNGQSNILPNPEGMKIVKAGAQRWLVVNAPAEKIWPTIRDFWLEMGFAVKKENPEMIIRARLINLMLGLTLLHLVRLTVKNLELVSSVDFKMVRPKFI
jgi:outer membrane protein assembly factor BamC